MLVRSTAVTVASRLSIACFSSHAFKPRAETAKRTPPPAFEFTQENLAEIEKLFAKYPPTHRASALIPMLHLAQKQNNNFLSLTAMNKVAKILGVNPLRVYEVFFLLPFLRLSILFFLFRLLLSIPCSIVNLLENISSQFAAQLLAN